MYMVYLRQDPSLGFQMVSEMVNFRDLHWECGKLLQKQDVS